MLLRSILISFLLVINAACYSQVKLRIEKRFIYNSNSRFEGGFISFFHRAIKNQKELVLYSDSTYIFYMDMKGDCLGCLEEAIISNGKWNIRKDYLYLIPKDSEIERFLIWQNKIYEIDNNGNKNGPYLKRKILKRPRYL